MKFKCPKCSKDFNLSAARLQGKIVRVRCTSCGSVFRIKVPGEAPAPEMATSAPPAGGAQPQEEQREQYFAIIGKKRLGPMPTAALARLIKENKVHRSTMIWCKGMKDWAPAEKDGFLASLFPPVETKPPVAPKATSSVPAPPPLPPRQEAGQTRSLLQETARETATEALAAKPAQPADSVESLLNALVEEEPDTTPAAKPSSAQVKQAAAETQPQPAEKEPVSAPAQANAASLEPALPDLAWDAPKPASSRHQSIQGGALPLLDDSREDDATLSTLEENFFAAGAVKPEPIRGLDEIQIMDEPTFPMEIEHRVEKGAKASLRDFSVMVRLSKKGRKKTVFVITGIASAAVLTVFAIFFFGDPSKSTGPEKQIAEDSSTGFQFSKTRTPDGNEAPSKSEKNGETRQKREELIFPEVPIAMMDDPGLELQNAEIKVDEDRVRLPDRKHRKGAGTHRTGFAGGAGAAEDDEGSLDDAIKAEKDRALREANGQGRPEIGVSGRNGAQTQEAQERESVMGTFGQKYLKERGVDHKIEERKGEGILTKKAISREVQRRMQADYRKVKRCADKFGGAGSIQLTLHFEGDGTVRAVEVRPRNAELASCIHSVLQPWRIQLVTQPVQIPISLQFQ